MAGLLKLRKTLFVLDVLMSLAVVGLLAHLTSLTEDVGFYYSSFALGIATGAVSFIGRFIFWQVDSNRRGAMTSLVWFELAWTAILWILWISTAVSITALGLFRSCDYVNAGVQSACRQFQAAEGLAYVLWLFNFLWFCTLLIISVVVAARDPSSNVWSSPVPEHPFFTDPAKVPPKNQWNASSYTRQPY